MSNGVERLWKNVQGYYGERIDIVAVQRDCLMAAQAHGWEAEKLKTSSEVELLAFSRRASSGTHHRFRLYISAGIHDRNRYARVATEWLTNRGARYVCLLCRVRDYRLHVRRR